MALASAAAGSDRRGPAPAERSPGDDAAARRRRSPRRDATRQSLPSATGHRRASRCCAISPVAPIAGATTAAANPAQSAHIGSHRESDRPSATSATRPATGRGERISACSRRYLRFPCPETGARIGPVMSPVWEVLSRFSSLSAGFWPETDWSPRFASNWTHHDRPCPVAAQPECSGCPKPGAFVHAVGSWRRALPIEASVDGAFAFHPSGSRYPRMRRASVAALKHRREPRCDAPDHRTAQEQL
jgi:hypothetical protein